MRPQRPPLTAAEAAQALRVLDFVSEITAGRHSHRFDSHLEGLAASLRNVQRREEREAVS